MKIGNAQICIHSDFAWMLGKYQNASLNLGTVVWSFGMSARPILTYHHPLHYSWNTNTLTNDCVSL